MMGGGGVTTIVGGSGNNVELGDYGTIDATDANNVVVTSAVDTAGNSDGNDVITTGDGNSVIIGGGGDDSLAAGNGGDLFFGDGGIATLKKSDYSVITAHTNTESAGGADTITVSGSGNNVAFGGRRQRQHHRDQFGQQYRARRPRQRR